LSGPSKQLLLPLSFKTQAAHEKISPIGKRTRKYLFFKGETILLRINFVQVDDASTDEAET
jgi:hypothetical protein